MIKTKALGTFIICSVLISGISASYILGMTTDEEQGNKEKTSLLGDGIPPSKSSTWKKAGAALCGVLALGAAIGGLYEWRKPPSSPTPAIPLKPNYLLVCPSILSLNKQHNCSSEKYYIDYHMGVHMAEAVYLGDCIDDCTGYSAAINHSWKDPRIFVGVENSPSLLSLLQKLIKKNIPHTGIFAYGSKVLGKGFNFYAYSSEHFHLPERHFTVPEIENDPEAMAVIKDFFEFQNAFHPTPCHEFRLVEE